MPEPLDYAPPPEAGPPGMLARCANGSLFLPFLVAASVYGEWLLAVGIAKIKTSELPAQRIVPGNAAAKGGYIKMSFLLIKTKAFPARALPVGRRIRVTTSSILAVIDTEAA